MSELIQLKLRNEIAEIHQVGLSLYSLFKHLYKIIDVGVSRIFLLNEIAVFLNERNLESSIFGFEGFPELACLSLNDVAAHGLMQKPLLEQGDILTIDIIANNRKFHADSAWTYVVGHNCEHEMLRTAAWQICNAGILSAVAGNTVGDIAWSMQTMAKRHKVKIIPNLLGHGIGYKAHEDPCIFTEGLRSEGQRLIPGMVITVEPVVCNGVGEIYLDTDQFSYRTVDSSVTAQFEQTIAIQKNETKVLTLPSQSLLRESKPPF